MMTTAVHPTTSPQIQLVDLGPIPEMPRSKAAYARRTAAYARKAALDAAVCVPEKSTDEQRAVAALLADKQKPERKELDLIDIPAAQRAIDAAMEADSAERRAQFHALKHECIKTHVLPALLAAQREMTKLQEIENREHEIVGFVDRFAWSSLGSNDLGDSFVNEWIRRAQAAGLIDVVDEKKK